MPQPDPATTLGQAGAIDAAGLRRDLARFDGASPVALLSKRYDRLLADALGAPPLNPLRGSRGIGEQRGILAKIARGEFDPLTMMPAERTPAEVAFGWLLSMPAVEHHVLRTLRIYDRSENLDKPESIRHRTRFVRGQALHCMGAALIAGYDGSELAPAARNDDEWRVGEIHVGSGLLRDLGSSATAVDWNDVRRRCEALIDYQAPSEGTER
jgi:hypothetical protein